MASGASVVPRELAVGQDAGFLLCGRVVGLLSKKPDLAEFHLVAGSKLDEVLFVDAWKEQSRRVRSTVQDGQIIQLSGLKIKSMGDKARWQASALDICGTIVARTMITPLKADDLKIPCGLPLTCLEDASQYSQTHQISIRGYVMKFDDTQNNVEVRNFWVREGNNSIRLAFWKDAVPLLEHVAQGEAYIFERLSAKEGKVGGVELQSTRQTQCRPVDSATKLLLDAAATNEVPCPLSKVPTKRVAYDVAPATQQSLSVLDAISVPEKCRDLGVDVYEVEHCLLRELAPLAAGENFTYVACSECSRKLASGTCAKHPQATQIRRYLVQCAFADATASVTVKAFEEPVRQLLQVTETIDQDNAEFHTCLAKAQQQHWTLRFVFSENQAASKNILQLVHATPTFTWSGQSADCKSNFEALQVIRSASKGVPPVALNDITLNKQEQAIMNDRILSTFQIFVQFLDTGEEKGIAEMDTAGQLVRVSRCVKCCLSQETAHVVRTEVMEKATALMRMNKDDCLHAVVRMEPRDEARGKVLRVLSFQKFTDDKHKETFQTYFWKFRDMTAKSLEAVAKLGFPQEMTPKRRKLLMDQNSSASAQTPRRLAFTPLGSTPS